MTSVRSQPIFISLQRLIYLCLFLSGISLCQSVSGQHLTRRPFLGVQVSQVTDSIARLNRQQQPKGAFVVRVIPNSTSATLAIQPGDIIVQLNDRAVAQWSELPTLARSLRTDERVQVTLVRQGKQYVLTGKVQPMPYETGQNAEVVYGEVPVVGGYARSILKKPKGQGPFPTVFYIQGFGCSSLDNLPERDSQRQLMDGLVARGYAVYRMDKPGVGDGQSAKPCSEIGYNEELAAFAAGLKTLKQQPGVDTTNVFLFGHSLGGNTAPLLAVKSKVKGIITYGAVGKPWLEYLIEVFREQRPVSGVDYVQIDEDMRTLLPLTYELLLLKKTPEELAKNEAYRPFLRENLDYDGRGHLFGRHYTFLQELQDIPFTKSWKEAGAHTLAMYGEADVQAIDADGARLVTDIVNQYHPGKATFALVPRTDHGFTEVGTRQDYRRLMDSGQYETVAAARFNQGVVKLIADWMDGKRSIP